MRRHGEAAVLREGRGEEGAVDAGGGPRARLLRAGARPRQLARRAHQHRYVLGMDLSLLGSFSSSWIDARVAVCASWAIPD